MVGTERAVTWHHIGGGRDGGREIANTSHGQAPHTHTYAYAYAYAHHTHTVS